MAYVGLNPIRAAIAKTPESSDFTSNTGKNPEQENQASSLRQQQTNIPYSLSDYLVLVDHTGRAVLENKGGYIFAELDPILNRHQLDPDSWMKEIQSFSNKGVTAIGSVNQLKAFCQSVGKQWGVGHILSPALEQSKKHQQFGC